VGIVDLLGMLTSVDVALQCEGLNLLSKTVVDRKGESEKDF
jgi:hypothetical protein